MYEASCIGLLGALVNVVDPWAVSWTRAYHALHRNTLPALAAGGMAGSGWLRLYPLQSAPGPQPAWN